MADISDSPAMQVLSFWSSSWHGPMTGRSLCLNYCSTFTFIHCGALFWHSCSPTYEITTCWAKCPTFFWVSPSDEWREARCTKAHMQQNTAWFWCCPFICWQPNAMWFYRWISIWHCLASFCMHRTTHHSFMLCHSGLATISTTPSFPLHASIYIKIERTGQHKLIL